jgi:hypothetical protein
VKTFRVPRLKRKDLSAPYPLNCESWAKLGIATGRLGQENYFFFETGPTFVYLASNQGIHALPSDEISAFPVRLL